MDYMITTLQDVKDLTEGSLLLFNEEIWTGNQKIYMANYHKKIETNHNYNSFQYFVANIGYTNTNLPIQAKKEFALFYLYHKSWDNLFDNFVIYNKDNRLVQIKKLELEKAIKDETTKAILQSQVVTMYFLYGKDVVQYRNNIVFTIYEQNLGIKKIISDTEKFIYVPIFTQIID